MLFTQVTTLILAVTLAHGSNEFDGNVQQFNSMQASLRRLQEPPVIPAACLAACPSLAAMVGRLTAAMLPHMGKVASMSSPPSANQTPDQMKAKMAEIMPLFKSLQMVNTADMCANQADYKCLSTNSDKCKSASEDGGMDLMDPVASAAKNVPLMECMCNKCQGAQKAQVDMSASMMSVMMAGFAQMAAAMTPGGGGFNVTDASKAQAKAMEKDILEGLCPLLGMKRCFDAYPTQCKDMLSMQNLMSMNSSAMGPSCTVAGIKAAVAPLVSTDITIKGLDYAKVVGDAGVKAQVIKMVKDAFIAILPGYGMQDLLVKLTKGSVVATVEVTPLPGASTEALLSIVKADPAAMATSIVTAVQNLDATKLATVLEDGKTKDKISATASAPSSPSASGTTASSTTGTTVSSTTGTTVSSAHTTAVFKILMAISVVGMILASM